MIFRKAVTKDLKEIMPIIKSAQDYLKKNKIDQWQNNYPNLKILKEDIKNNNLYILEINGEIVAVAAIIFAEDPFYNKITDGEWLKNGFYGAIHRAAVAKKFKGQNLISEFFSQTYKMAQNLNADSIRIDTHRDNLAMRKVVEKEGFNYCGIIRVRNGSERLAYEKLIK